MHWIIVEGIHSTFSQFVWCIPSQGPSGEKSRGSLGRRIVSLRDTLLICFFRLRVNSSPLFKKKKKRKKKKNSLEKSGSKKRVLVEKRCKRVEKCPFKTIILKIKHQKKVARVG